MQSAITNCIMQIIKSNWVKVVSFSRETENNEEQHLILLLK